MEQNNQIEESRRSTTKAWPNSTNVLSTDYDIDEKVLKVTFKNGTAYCYQDVPPEVWKQLLTCSSIGSFIATNIKKNYKSVKL